MPDNEQPKNYQLPLSIAQPVDVGRLLREIGLIDEHLNQDALRHEGRKIIVKASPKLNELLETNSIDITDSSERSKLKSWLEDLKATAPRVNLSFSSDSSEDFNQKVAEWYRREVDPRCLIVIGLEPSIGIGSIVRTTNKVFDLSLKNRLKASTDLLLAQIQQAAARSEQ